MEIIYKTDKNSSWGVTGSFEGSRVVFLPEDNASLSEKQINLYGLFSPAAKRAWLKASKLAKARGEEAGVEDIFLALIQEPSVTNLFARLKVETRDAENLLSNYLKIIHVSTEATVKIIPFEAFNFSLLLGNRKIGSLMLLAALLKNTEHANILQAIFTNIDLTLERLELYTVWALNLNFDFPENSKNRKLLYCLKQAQNLEEHFGYFYELPAVEAAVKISAARAFKNLVKAGLLAKRRRIKLIDANLVKEAAK